MPVWLQDLWQNPYLSALAVLAGGFVAAFLVEQITARVILRIASKTRTDLDDALVGALRRPLFVSVVLAAAWLALQRAQVTGGPLFASQAVLLTLAVLLWAGGVARAGKIVLGALAGRLEDYQIVQPRTQPLFEISITILVWGGATYGILLAWNVDVTAWLASAGILGIAVGFAAKDTLANLFSGIFILADTPYKLGDYIVLDSGERGMVTDIGIRTTRLLTRDDIQIILPNAAIANAKIVNESGGNDLKQRVKVSVGVAYGSDVDQVRELLMNIAAEAKYLAKDPEPRVRFRALGESSLDFQLMGWIDDPTLRGRAVDDLLTTIYKTFNAEGVQIPFPQRDVHLIQNEQPLR